MATRVFVPGDATARSVGADLATVFADALRARAQPRINQSVLDNVTGQQQ